MKTFDSSSFTRTPNTQSTFGRVAFRFSICLAMLSSLMSSHLQAEEVFNNLDADTSGYWWGAGPLSDPHRMAGPDRTSQQFDLGGNHTITNVDLQLVRGGTPTGSVTFEIWEDDGAGYPGERVGTLGSIEDISTFEPAPETWDEVLALGSEPNVSFDTVVSGLNPALPHHVVVDYTEATGIDTDGFRWLATNGQEGSGPQTLVVGADFPRLTTPLDDEGYGFGATPDLFSASGLWILQSDIPSFDGNGFQFANMKMSVTAVPEPASQSIALFGLLGLIGLRKRR